MNNVNANNVPRRNGSFLSKEDKKMKNKQLAIHM